MVHLVLQIVDVDILFFFAVLVGALASVRQQTFGYCGRRVQVLHHDRVGLLVRIHAHILIILLASIDLLPVDGFKFGFLS